MYILYLPNLSCLDTQCVTLDLSDGLEMSCDSTYTTGVGYEGDTCNFTCNTGYEFTGSETRTCLSNSSWSGAEAICTRGVYCIYNMLKCVENITQYSNQHFKWHFPCLNCLLYDPYHNSL